MERIVVRFPAFQALLDRVATSGAGTFAAVEAEFLAAMGAFDLQVAAGTLSSGENQAKGQFLVELVALLAENRSGVDLARRARRPGVLLQHVDVDLCHPLTGTPELVVEAKMAGTPKHPGSPTAGPLGRRASADVDKRVRELALSVIDLKLGSMGGEFVIGDVPAWLRETLPRFVAVFGLRVIDEADRRAALDRLRHLASSYASGVGVALFEPADPSSAEGRVSYRPIPSPAGMSVDDAVQAMCASLRRARVVSASRWQPRVQATR
jgi:hypothetical protein